MLKFEGYELVGLEFRLPMNIFLNKDTKLQVCNESKPLILYNLDARLKTSGMTGKELRKVGKLLFPIALTKKLLNQYYLKDYFILKMQKPSREGDGKQHIFFIKSI